MDTKIFLTIVSAAVGLFLGWGVIFPRREEPGTPAEGAFPGVSVIVPARNEAHRIGRLLESMRRQSVAPYEFLVVDDGSTDGTAEMAREGGATVIEGAPLPEGWNGKQWSCWQGAQRAEGELLLFLDADVWIEDDGIEKLLRLRGGREGLLSVQPYHVTREPYEQLSAFCNAVVVTSVGAFTPLGEHVKPGGAFGPCILAGREAYFRTGGHAEIRSEVLDDVPLGQIFQKHGFPVRCYTGRGILSFRMYPGGFAELLRGWSKGMGTGALSVNPLFSLLIVAWISGAFGVSVFLARAFLDPAGPPWWAALLLYALYAVEMGLILKRLGRFKWWAWALFPVPLIFFGVLSTWSLFSTVVLGHTRWKGRTLDAS